MATFKLRRFSQPDRLKTIAPQRLIQFFTPYRPYLARRGFDLPVDPSTAIDYEGLAKVLMSPDESVPGDMVDALYYVHETADDGALDHLLDAVRRAGLIVNPDPDMTAADLAVHVWLVDSRILERVHAEALVVRPKSFQYFQGRGGGPRELPTPDASVLETLQIDLDLWLDEHRRGTGSKVLIVDRGEKVWFLVRHGTTMRREGSINAGEWSSVYYRPAVHDVLVYDAEKDVLGVHAATKGEVALYLTKFGLHVFGDADYFPAPIKFTLDPLKADGPASLACKDVTGLDRVKLVEVHRALGSYGEVEIRKATDVFAALRDRGASIPINAKLIRAVFAVKFQDAKTPRRVTVCPPNLATYTRDDGEIVERWLELRKFIRPAVPAPDAQLDPAMVGA